MIPATEQQPGNAGIMSPKVIGGIAAGIVAVIVHYVAKYVGVNLSVETQGYITVFLISALPQMAYGIGNIMSARISNPANVASPASIVPTAPAGTPNVTSEPQDPPAELRG